MPEEVKPTPGRMSGEARREAILDAAVELFSERGFRSVTTRELAQAVGVTEPVLYHHFKDKRDLYGALIERKTHQATGTLERFERLFQNTPDDRLFLIGVAQLMIDWHESDPTYIRLLLRSALDDREFYDLSFEKKSCLFWEMLAREFGRRMELGSLRPMDPTQAAVYFGCMVGHFCLLKHLFRYPGEAPPVSEALENMVSIFLQGIQKSI